MAHVHRLEEAYRGRANFVSVYLSEAHAADEYPLGRHVVVNRHTTLSERAAAASGFASAVGWRLPLLLDGMDDALAVALSAHPERYYVLEPALAPCPAAQGEGVPAERAGEPMEQAAPPLLSAHRTRLLFCAPGRRGGYRLDDLETFLRNFLGAP